MPLPELPGIPPCPPPPLPAALATTSIKNAADEGTVAATALAWILIALAVSALVLVGLRFAYHHLRVVRGFDSWPDPLFDK